MTTFNSLTTLILQLPCDKVVVELYDYMISKSHLTTLDHFTQSIPLVEIIFNDNSLDKTQGLIIGLTKSL